jgi:hypothetical protein
MPCRTQTGAQPRQGRLAAARSKTGIAVSDIKQAATFLSANEQHEISGAACRPGFAFGPDGPGLRGAPKRCSALCLGTSSAPRARRLCEIRPASLSPAGLNGDPPPDGVCNPVRNISCVTGQRGSKCSGRGFNPRPAMVRGTPWLTVRIPGTISARPGRDCPCYTDGDTEMENEQPQPMQTKPGPVKHGESKCKMAVGLPGGFYSWRAG